MSQVKPIAIYLPQFHPIPENDEWWGKGFTEWINVSKSMPKFSGHYQPHIPKDLGFYDLRLLETMEEQAKLAKEYGVYGFCYYHYWFNGKLLLERPIEQMLNSGKPDMPFCLCWANENWTRRWDGKEQNVLIKQDYSLEDDLNHINYLISFFKDERYIKIDNKPVYIMYRSELHPNIKEATLLWREEVKKAGFDDLYLIRVENFVKNINPAEHGFDAGMEFAPDILCRGEKYSKKNPIKHFITKKLHNLGVHKSAFFENEVYDYNQLADNMMAKPKSDYKYFRCVCPSWDNSARRTINATLYHDATPQKFTEWVKFIKNYTTSNFNSNEQIFFINAWNEWAEGCHLEPDQKYGLEYLHALKQGLE